MLDRAAILGLIPHQGRMCLLDRVERWDADGILCSALSHLDPDNPLRRDGTLHAVAGIEYALQAAASHGALQSGAPAGPGLLASLRAVRFHVARLDDPALGRILAQADLLTGAGHGSVYAFSLRTQDGRALLEGRAALTTARAACV